MVVVVVVVVVRLSYFVFFSRQTFKMPSFLAGFGAVGNHQKKKKKKNLTTGRHLNWELSDLTESSTVVSHTATLATAPYSVFWQRSHLRSRFSFGRLHGFPRRGG